MSRCFPEAITELTLILLTKIYSKTMGCHFGSISPNEGEPSQDRRHQHVSPATCLMHCGNCKLVSAITNVKTWKPPCGSVNNRKMTQVKVMKQGASRDTQGRCSKRWADERVPRGTIAECDQKKKYHRRSTPSTGCIIARQRKRLTLRNPTSR